MYLTSHTRAARVGLLDKLIIRYNVLYTYQQVGGTYLGAKQVGSVVGSVLDVIRFRAAHHDIYFWRSGGGLTAGLCCAFPYNGRSCLLPSHHLHFVIVTKIHGEVKVLSTITSLESVLNTSTSPRTLCLGHTPKHVKCTAKLRTPSLASHPQTPHTTWRPLLAGGERTERGPKRTNERTRGKHAWMAPVSSVTWLVP